jgi:hypothetical protein
MRFVLGGVGVVWGWFLGWVLVLVLWVLAVLWVWLPRAGGVVGFLAGEAGLGGLWGGGFDRLLGLVGVAGGFESMFFGGGDGVVCLGYYVVWWGHTYRVYVVVAYHSREPVIEAINIEEWVTVSRAKGLDKSHTRPP